MKKYLVDTPSGRAGPLTDEEVRSACQQGKFGRNATIASYIGLGVSASFESIVSVSDFGAVIAQRESHVQQQQLQKVAELDAMLTNPIAKILARHVWRYIRVNYSAPDATDPAWLIDVNDSLFTIQLQPNAFIHVPMSQVLHMMESGDTLLIRITQLVLYKGFTSVGVAMPIAHERG